MFFYIFFENFIFRQFIRNKFLFQYSVNNNNNSIKYNNNNIENNNINYSVIYYDD